VLVFYYYFKSTFAYRYTKALTLQLKYAQLF